MIRKLFLTFLAGLVLGLGVAFWHWRARDQISGFDSIDRVTLYSLDGRGLKEQEEIDYEEYFHKIPVLGKIELQNDDRDRMLNAMNQGIAEGYSAAACFWPRHGVRIESAGVTTDYVICFHCYFMYVHEGTTEKTISTSRRPKPVFNELLVEAGVPLAPE